jgi:carbon-monoxide dehydrogenase small subunit
VKKEIAVFNINEKLYEVILTPNITLAELLRDKLDLTGTKCSCGAAECGSCTVLVDGQPTYSCSTLAIACRDKKILTIEGLATDGELHPLQKAFVEAGAVQCGFCTPGMIMMAKAFLDENPNPSRVEVREGLSGNLCRCTGYVKIIDAVMAAVEMIGKGGS